MDDLKEGVAKAAMATKSDDNGYSIMHSCRLIDSVWCPTSKDRGSREHIIIVGLQHFGSATALLVLKFFFIPLYFPGPMKILILAVWASLT